MLSAIVVIPRIGYQPWISLNQITCGLNFKLILLAFSYIFFIKRFNCIRNAFSEKENLQATIKENIERREK